MNQGVKDLVHRQIVRNLDMVCDWFSGQRSALDIPLYSSFDIRDSDFKIANVDGNIYPAGFNNICAIDRENLGSLARSYIHDHYGSLIKRVVLLTEEHRQNLYYWDNVGALCDVFRDAGLEIDIAMPRLPEAIAIKSASGREIRVHPAIIEKGQILTSMGVPDLVVSNNDFSDDYQEWGILKTIMNPPRELGWYQRKKSNYFNFYNDLSYKFAELIGIDPWYLTVQTELFENFDLSNSESMKAISARAQMLFTSIEKNYAKRDIRQKPVVFVKNNAGTYGLAVIRVESADELVQLSYKTRKKMKAAKGGRDVLEVILQEGIPSVVQSGGATAEPAIYLLGCQLAGGFLRAHSEKGPTESLNSPGAVFKRLCVSDLKISVEGHPLENVYGWVAKLGLLAIGMEAREMKVQYQSYKRTDSGRCT